MSGILSLHTQLVQLCIFLTNLFMSVLCEYVMYNVYDDYTDSTLIKPPIYSNEKGKMVLEFLQVN